MLSISQKKSLSKTFVEKQKADSSAIYSKLEKSSIPSTPISNKVWRGEFPSNKYGELLSRYNLQDTKDVVN